MAFYIYLMSLNLSFPSVKSKQVAIILEIDKVTKVKATNIGVAKLNSHNNLVRFQLESKPLHLLTLHELGFTGASCTHGHLLTLDHKLTNTIHSPPSQF